MYRILIVEDDFDIAELLENWLGEAGYQTVCAQDGLSALEIFDSQRFDLMLLDLLRRVWTASACANGCASAPICPSSC